MSQILSFPDPSGRGGLALPPDPSRPTLSEAWSDSAGPAASAFVLSALARPGPVLWVQDRVSGLEAGRPYAVGLRREVLLVRAGRMADALMALEMGLGCPALAAVVGEVWGEAPRLDFTATQRLALRAERAGVPCWLIRRAAAPGLSAARERWRVDPLPSAPDPWDARAPGAPRWRAELFRSRTARPGAWQADLSGPADDRAADRLRLAPLAGDGSLVGGGAARPGRAAR